MYFQQFTKLGKSKNLHLSLLSKTALVSALLSLSAASVPVAHAEELIDTDQTVSGSTGGTLENPLSSDLIIVSSSNGNTLTISEGGSVLSFLTLIGDQAGSSGSVVIDGTNDADGVTSQLMSGGIAVGAEGGTGTLTISNGALAYSYTGIIGAAEKSVGSAVVSDDSIWVIGDPVGLLSEEEAAQYDLFKLLYVGRKGEGSLSIENGGHVNTPQLIIGQYDGSTGTVSVTREGSQLDSTFLAVGGEAGQGELKISDGASVFGYHARIGEMEGADGRVSVSGAGSQWIVAESDLLQRNDDLAGLPEGIWVGREGNGSLIVEDGGYVETQQLIIGEHATSTGSAAISGASSKLDVSENLYVGLNGSGSLTVENGAAFSTYEGLIGGDYDNNSTVGTGSVIITGKGSSWSNTGFIDVGSNGEGSLVISDSGSVASEDMYVGYNQESNGDIQITGEGSRLDVHDGLEIGWAGTGSVTISDNGVLSVGDGEATVRLAVQQGSFGTLNIGAAADAEAAAAGYLEAAEINFGAGEGLLVFNHTDEAYEFGTSLTGNVDLAFISGNTNLAGDYSNIGEITVSGGGTLSVNKKAGDIVVGDRGTLGGVGTAVSVTVNSGGTLAPGNSIGTLTVSDLVFNADSAYNVEVHRDGDSDLTIASNTLGSGTVDIIDGASVNVTPENGADNGFSYNPATTYTIITADGGLTGEFSNISDSFLFLDSALSYDANNAFLTLTRNANAIASLVETENQKATAGALKTLTSGSVFTGFMNLTNTRDVSTALDALSGEIHASVNGVLIEDSRFVREAALARTIQGAPQVWGEAYGAWGNWDGDKNTASVDRRVGGFLMGIDAPINETLSAGFTAGYGNSSIDVDEHQSSASIGSYHLGAYGVANFGATLLKSGISYSLNQIDIDRTATFSEDLTADYNSNTFQLFTEAGYRVETSLVNLTPIAGLAYIKQHTEGFEEKGGDAALSVDSSSTNTAISNLGLRIERTFAVASMRGSFTGSAAWQHVYGDNVATSTNKLGGESFTITGASFGRDTAIVDAGLQLQLTENAILSVNYDGRFAEDVRDHGVRASFAAKF
ncbi:Extracellular serine protease precursor [Pseudovibrio sp. Ad37]|nr:Extracellular serine protease precursor [Pseudovibrio sp. Ad37]